MASPSKIKSQHERITRGESTTQLLKFFKKSRVDIPDELGRNPLHLAAQAGRIDLIRGLLRKGASINAQDCNGWTPLHAAASNQHFKACSVLLESLDIDPTSTNNEGTTALHYLVRYSIPHDEQMTYESLLRQFFKRGADLNAQNNYGEAPLHSACMRGNIVAVRFILEKQANPNITTKIGETPLHYAVRANNIDIVKDLLAHDADPRLLSDNGSPTDVASQYNLMPLFELLTMRASELGPLPRPPSPVPSLQLAESSSATPPPGPVSPSPTPTRRVGFEQERAKAPPDNRGSAEFSDDYAQISPLYQDGSLKKGYLKLLLRRRWVRFWFVLKEETLFYYESAQDHEPKGLLPFDSLTRVRPVVDVKKIGAIEHTFELFVAGESQIFAADDQADQADWFDLLTSLCHPPVQQPHSNSSQDGENQRSDSTSDLSSTGPDASLTMGANDTTPVHPKSSACPEKVLSPTERRRNEMRELIRWLVVELAQDLPLEETLFRLLLTDRTKLLSCLSFLDGGTIDTEDFLSQGLHQLFTADKSLAELLRSTISMEITQNKHSPSTLFRSTSLATRVSSLHLFSDEGIQLLMSPGFVSDVIRRVVSVPHSLEIDPEKCPEGVDPAANINLLTSIAKEFLSNLFNSVNRFPPSWRLLLSFLLTETDSQIPEMGRPAVGNFLFLRFFCPSIVSPLKHNLIHRDAINPSNQRGLMLLAKLVQNLANGIEFDGSKERYMQHLNPFILEYKDQIDAFFIKLTDPNLIEIECQKLPKPPINPPKEIACLRAGGMTNLLKFLNSRQAMISSSLRDSGFKEAVF